MPTYITLPPELVGLEGKVQWVQQVNPNEYHMSCPNCGFSPTHSDSHPSDRFVVWIESRFNGRPFGMCVRHCGFKWSPDKADAVWTPEEKAAFIEKKKELNQRENERILQYAKDVVMKQAVYLKYMEKMESSVFGKMYLEQRGFNSNEWNKWFGYGILEDYKCHGELSTYYTPAITMPVMGLNKIVENVKLRVADAHHPKDRFRNLYKSGNQHPYFPMHDEKVGNKVAIFEGEMKSNQVAMRGNLPENVQVIATQGKGIGSRLAYMLENCEVVYLCLDPDAFVPNEKGQTGIMQAATRLGAQRVRIITCKQKVDDAILKGFNLLNAFNMAVKPAQLGLS
jgi:hypothetical protein